MSNDLLDSWKLKHILYELNYHGPLNPVSPVPAGQSIITIYGYVPSRTLALVALATFGLVFFMHAIYFLLKRGTRTFHFLLVLGCAMEITGFVFRTLSSTNAFVINWFILQYFMIVVAPVFFAAALYLSLSIAVRRTDSAHLLPIKPWLMVTIFVFIDIVTISLQVVGAAFVGISESQIAREKKPILPVVDAVRILLAGLAFQAFSFLIFMLIFLRAAYNNYKQSSLSDDREESEKALGTEFESESRPIRPLFFFVLGLSSVAIWTRTLFRVGETVEGVFGYASTHEILFAGLEYVPVIIAVGLWAVCPLFMLLPPVTESSGYRRAAF